ncbi:beta-lactamase family protein [Ruminiclostridium sufflavum DSM 19573]|uniref:Beta-lactamase family protein n=1 Tax=Ruminiclostridium sufflavum DSM 19573 TaxID=1121337 RepID=A0A318XJB1_9FIRM|nr:MBL fold metallo-hydrolase [Ruminiclostridium sufflavum]PYG87335.1 beta-lactamase family protein [Ruminiclostridium sufflavum DSM 19573]
MSKTKILTTVLIVFVLLFGGAFLLNHANFFSNGEPTDSNKGSGKAAQNIAANGEASLGEQESDVKEEPEEKGLKDFTDGIWIKKYPENYACFKFETPEGIKIVADPYMMDEIVEPDIVTESHQHSDHTDVSKLQGTYKLIKETGEYDEKGIKINGYSGKHNKGDTAETNIIFTYVINGIKIAHFASQGELPSDETLEKIKNADVLLVQASIKPEYANSKMNLEETKHIIDKLNPKIVIPEHGSENLGKALAAYLNLKVEFVKKGEIVVTRSELDASKGLRVLDIDTDVPKD